MLTHKGTQTLMTDRLILRRFVPEDAEAMYCNWASEELVTRHLTWLPHENVAAIRALLEQWVQNYDRPDWYQWAIMLREEGQPIGSISVVSHDDRAQRAEIGYCIGSRWWNRGVMTEALGAVMGFLFEEVGMGRVEAKHDPENPHSGAVMRKCGMRFEGTLRKSIWSNRGIVDVDCYSMLAEEWKK